MSRSKSSKMPEDINIKNNNDDNEFIPFWLKLLGQLSRNIPNFYKIKDKLMWILMPKVRGKNYRTIIRYDLGQKILLHLDDWIPIQLFWMGVYYVERKHTEHFKKLIKPGDIVIDVGANIGYYTLMAAARVGKRGHVYAFEPASHTFKILQKNIQINGFTNVSLYNLAISNEEGYVELYLSDSINTGATSITVPELFSGKVEKVRCITIDNFLNKENIKKVDLIKIDVEGAEPKVLRGMNKLLSEQNPKILIEINEERLRSAGHSKDYIYEFLASKGYKAYDISGKKTKPIHNYVEGSLILFSKSI